MGVPEERYSRITNKNRREICLLRSFPCAWGKCAFCDYTDDNGTDEASMIRLNRETLSRRRKRSWSIQTGVWAT